METSIQDHQIPNISAKPRYVANKNDVLFGRGNHTKNHAGNKYYRLLVSSVKHMYHCYPKERKQVISELIFDCIKSLDPPGLFMHETDRDTWEELNKHGVLRKISQALREKKCLVPVDHVQDRRKDNEEERIHWMKTMLQQVAQENHKPVPTFTQTLLFSNSKKSTSPISCYVDRSSNTPSFYTMDSQQHSSEYQYPSTLPSLQHPSQEPTLSQENRPTYRSLPNPSSTTTFGLQSNYDSYEVASVLSSMKFQSM